jgi:hypothetical protein
LTFDTRAVVTGDGQLYPLGSDTKVLSSVFELVTRPLVYEIAAKHKLQVREASAQNVYPDFTLMRDVRDRSKIAVDVKTTYRTLDSGWRCNFTLGSYTSFIHEARKKKNIEFPFDEYSKHWIIGYIYKRKPPVETGTYVYDWKDLKQIPVPFEDVDIFVQEKWRIAGTSAGSGNTTNIGSINGTLDDFRNGNTPFESEEEFLDYWRGYGRTAAVREDAYSNIAAYRALKKDRDA